MEIVLLVKSTSRDWRIIRCDHSFGGGIIVLDPATFFPGAAKECVIYPQQDHMSYQQLTFRAAVREKVLQGAKLSVDAVRVTMGPKAKCVLIEKKWGSPIVCARNTRGVDQP